MGGGGVGVVGWWRGVCGHGWSGGAGFLAGGDGVGPRARPSPNGSDPGTRKVAKLCAGLALDHAQHAIAHRRLPRPAIEISRGKRHGAASRIHRRLDITALELEFDALLKFEAGRHRLARSSPSTTFAGDHGPSRSRSTNRDERHHHGLGKQTVRGFEVAYRSMPSRRWRRMSPEWSNWSQDGLTAGWSSGSYLADLSEC